EVDDYVVALGHAKASARNLYRPGQEISVVGNVPESNGRVRIVQVSKEQLVEPRRPHIQPAEAISARLYFQEGLHLAVHQERIAKYSVQVEQVEGYLPILIKHLIGEVHPYVKLREAWQAEAVCVCFVAVVFVIEEQVVAVQSLVDVLRSVVNAMIVIPQRAHGLVDVAALSLVGGEDSSQHVRIVLIIPIPPLEEIARVAI